MRSLLPTRTLALRFLRALFPRYNLIIENNVEVRNA